MIIPRSTDPRDWIADGRTKVMNPPRPERSEAVDDEVAAERGEFYRRIDEVALAPLWEVMKGLVAPEPRPTPRAHIWRYDVVRPFLMEAGALLSAAEAERRVLILENPAFPAMSRATAS